MKLNTAAGKIEVSSVSASFSFSILAEKRLDGITNDVDENSIGGASPLQWKKTILLFSSKKPNFCPTKTSRDEDVLFPGKRDNF